mmetsp:Transcript_27292/g.57149  ORF Transcript_27292/g.57149 Transcript_27292/m.57149 type:complete len:263 (-) Transcript_27292:620-1408(-)
MARWARARSFSNFLLVSFRLSARTATFPLVVLDAACDSVSRSSACRQSLSSFRVQACCSRRIRKSPANRTAVFLWVVDSVLVSLRDCCSRWCSSFEADWAACNRSVSVRACASSEACFEVAADNSSWCRDASSSACLVRSDSARSRSSSCFRVESKVDSSSERVAVACSAEVSSDCFSDAAWVSNTTCRSLSKPFSSREHSSCSEHLQKAFLNRSSSACSNSSLGVMSIHSSALACNSNAPSDEAVLLVLVFFVAILSAVLV